MAGIINPARPYHGHEPLQVVLVVGPEAAGAASDEEEQHDEEGEHAAACTLLLVGAAAAGVAAHVKCVVTGGRVQMRAHMMRMK